MSVQHAVSPGDWVADRQPKNDDETLLVLEVTDTPSTEHAVYTEPDGTVHPVAEFNDDAFADSPAVEVAYLSTLTEQLREDLPAWNVEAVLELYESGELTDKTDGYGVRAYSFPEARLKTVDSDE